MNSIQRIVCISSLALCLLSPAFFAGSSLNVYERGQRQTVLVRDSEGIGSGVLVSRIDPDGKQKWFVWTAAHVVEDSTEVIIKTYDHSTPHRTEKKYAGKVLARNAALDVALIYIIDPGDNSFLPATFAADPAHVGDKIFIVGNSGGDFDGTVSTGIISQVNVDQTKNIPGWPWGLVDQTCASVFPGNSGGPVCNERGQVLGLLVGSVSPTMNVFVPVRTIEAWAKSVGFGWALRGTSCPR